jgi:hypothetical protein
MFLGSVSCAYNQVKRHTERINELKDKHKFNAEIKWTNVSKSKLRFYEELTDYFFYTDLKFRTVGVDKSKINYEVHGKTYDEFYYTIYYYLLNKVEPAYNYNVYLDIKDSLSANKVNKLKDILNTKLGVFRNVQNIRSHESILMQLADFLMGAISYQHNNMEKKNTAKVKIINRIMQHSGETLLKTNYSNKLSLFFIELQ